MAKLSAGKCGVGAAGIASEASAAAVCCPWMLPSGVLGQVLQPGSWQCGGKDLEWVAMAGVGQSSLCFGSFVFDILMTLGAVSQKLLSWLHLVLCSQKPGSSG